MIHCLHLQGDEMAHRQFRWAPSHPCCHVLNGRALGKNAPEGLEWAECGETDAREEAKCEPPLLPQCLEFTGSFLCREQWSALLFPMILRGRCCHYLHVIRQWRLTSLCNLSEVTQYKAELVSEFTRFGSGIHAPLQVERMGGHVGGCGGRGGQGQVWVKNWQKGQGPERNPFWYIVYLSWIYS